MDTKYEFGFEEKEANAIVYVRSVKVADLPEDVQEQAGGLDTLYMRTQRA